MTRDLNSEYFEWLCSLIRDSKPVKRVLYKRLMTFLYHTEFVYTLAMDANRYADGVDLRYRFGYECGIERNVIASCLDTNPCSVLEMMVALAFRCEEHIMGDPNVGMLSGRWFWRMITNLGLAEMYDSNYDESMVNSVVYCFLNRAYSPDGEGNIVYMPDTQYDLRSMDIWYQMMGYLNEYLRNGVE